jgi:ribosomal protein L13E
MTARNEAKLTTFRNTSLTCYEYRAITATVPAFETNRLLLDTKISAITHLAAAEKEVRMGVGKSKQISQDVVCMVASDAASLAYAYASTISNQPLKAIMGVTITGLKRLSKEELVGVLTNIKKGVQANLKELETFGLSATHANLLNMAIDDYTNQVAKPQNARTVLTTYTKGIKQLIKETDTLLKEQLDKLIVCFKNAHPEFVAKYKASRTIYDPPTQRTQIKGKVLAGDSGKQVKNATVQLAGPTELLLQTNAAGNFTIKPLPPGTYQVLVKAAGFADTVLEELVVKLGKVTRVAVNLTAA